MKESEIYRDDITLLDYINTLKKHKKLIIIMVVIAVACTAIISLLSPKIYQSQAVIMHVSNVKEQSSINSIASQFGITSTQTSSSVSEIVALLNSNILMEKVVKKHGLTQVLLNKSDKNKKASEQVWKTIRLLKKKIYKAQENKREGVIELSAEYKDPEIAAKILTYILTELTDYMSSEAIRVAQTNKKYLESQVDRNADPLIKQKIYSLIAKQIETSMLAEVKENFAFKVLDPPKVPVKKIKPSIIKNIIISLVIALFTAVFLAFFLEYYNNLKALRKNSES